MNKVKRKNDYKLEHFWYCTVPKSTWNIWRESMKSDLMKLGQMLFVETLSILNVFVVILVFQYVILIFLKLRKATLHVFPYILSHVCGRLLNKLCFRFNCVLWCFQSSTAFLFNITTKSSWGARFGNKLTNFGDFFSQFKNFATCYQILLSLPGYNEMKRHSLEY